MVASAAFLTTPPEEIPLTFLFLLMAGLEESAESNAAERERMLQSMKSKDEKCQLTGSIDGLEQPPIL